MDCRRFRMTRQRQVILEELGKVDTHPTADEIYERVRQRIPRISLGTVYRNLELLAESSVIQRLDGCDTQRRFDGNPANHYHILCEECGRVDDLPFQPLSSIDEIPFGISDYEVHGHLLIFTGLCPACHRHKSGEPERTAGINRRGKTSESQGH